MKRPPLKIPTTEKTLVRQAINVEKKCLGGESHLPLVITLLIPVVTFITIPRGPDPFPATAALLRHYPPPSFPRPHHSLLIAAPIQRSQLQESEGRLRWKLSVELLLQKRKDIES